MANGAEQTMLTAILGPPRMCLNFQAWKERSYLFGICTMPGTMLTLHFQVYRILKGNLYASLMLPFCR